MSLSRFRRVSFATVLVLALLVIAACGSPKPSTPATGGAAADKPAAEAKPAAPTATQSTAPAEPIKVGIIYSLTGGLSWLGQDEHDAIELFIKLKNDAGGIKGRKIKPIYFDDQTNPEQADRGARQMVSEGVPVVVGPSGTPTSYAAEAVLDRAKIPMISMSGGYVPKSQMAWTTTFSTAQQVERMLSAIKAQGKRRIAVITSQDALGQIVKAAVEAYVPKLGLEQVGFETFQPSDVNFQAQLTRLNKANPEVVMALASGDPIAVIYRQLRELGSNVPYYVLSSSATDKFLQAVGKAADGSIVSPASKLQVYDQLPAADPMKKSVDGFVTTFRQAHKDKTPTFTHGMGWDGILVAVTALEAVGTDPAAINKFLEQGKQGIIGVNGVFNHSPANRVGLSAQDQALITNVGGKWQIAKG